MDSFEFIEKIDIKRTLNEFWNKMKTKTDVNVEPEPRGFPDIVYTFDSIHNRLHLHAPKIGDFFLKKTDFIKIVNKITYLSKHEELSPLFGLRSNISSGYANVEIIAFTIFLSWFITYKVHMKLGSLLYKNWRKLFRNPFKFLNTELKLDVKNLKTMMVHHTQVWNLLNISNEPRDFISFDICGDKPKKFKDLKASVKDANGKKLKILDTLFLCRQTNRKTFTVRLDNAIKPNKSKILKLEWDWEEPNRSFTYVFGAHCKKFSCTFTAPKSARLKLGILKRDTEKGWSTYAAPSSEGKYPKDRTVNVWRAINLHPGDFFEFRW